MTNEEKHVIEAVEHMTRAFHQQDLPTVMASYEKNATIMFEPGQPVSNRPDIETAFSSFFQLSPQFSYPKGHEVYLCDDLALHISPWEMMGKAPDGTAVNQQGLSVAVLRKQKTGEWQLVIDNPHGQKLQEN